MINNKYTIKAVSILLSATLIYACNEKTEIPEYNYTSDRIVVKTEVEGFRLIFPKLYIFGY